jgi:hypothetical protein
MRETAPQLSPWHDRDVLRRLLDPDVLSSDRDGDAGHRDRMTDRGRQQAARPVGFVPAVPHVRLPDAVDHEGVATDPEPSARVVLGVEREHAARADHEMVDVRTSPADRDRVQTAPPGVAPHQTLQLTTNPLLADSAEAPCAFVGVHARQSG